MPTPDPQIEPSDGQLLAQHLQGQSPEAFAQLVRRHIDFVYSVARRQLHDPHLAEDVTQNVFLLLVQKGPTLHNHPNLGGWLFHAAMLESHSIQKRRSREAQRLTQIVSSLGKQDNPMQPPNWEEIEPHLNQALEDLSSAEREAVVLRYFHRQSYDRVAAALGLTEAAARQRVHRGLDHLRSFLEGKGVVISATALAADIKLNGVQAAPAHLAESTIAATANLSAAATATGAIALASIKAKLIALALLLASAGLIAGVAAVIAHRRHQGQTLYLAPAPLDPQRSAAAPPLNTIRPPFDFIRGLSFDDHQGTRPIGGFVAYINKGDWLRFNRVDLGPPGTTGATFNATITTPASYAGNTIQVHMDTLTGPILSTLTVKSTGGYGNWQPQSAPLASRSGVHDLFLVFSGGGWNLDGFRIMLPKRPAMAEIPAISFNESNGVQTRAGVVSETANGQWLRFGGLEFSREVNALALVYACDNSQAGGTISIHLDRLDGPIAAEWQVPSTGSYGHYVTRIIPITPISGTHDIILLFSGPQHGIANLRSLRFLHRSSTAATTPAAGANR